jgi:anti-sigma-K factor RskA
MRHERATEELREVAALYALGSLTQHEARSFEIHMREECPVCEAEFHRFQRIVAGIGFAVEEVAVPEYLRDLLLARIERANQVPAPAAAPEKVVETRPQQEKTPPLRPARPILSQTPQPKSRFQAFFLAAIATVLGLIAFYAWRSAWEAKNQLQAKLSAASADAENLRIMLDVQKGRTGELEQILATAGKPGIRIVRLAGQAAAPSASGVLLWDDQQKQCLAFGYFSPAPEGSVYQLWFITPKEKIPAGLLKVDPTGRVFSATSIPPEITGITAVAVTVEPDGGARIPTMPFYATGPLD